jgi:fluoroacetyl-CoA thioesterase
MRSTDMRDIPIGTKGTAALTVLLEHTANRFKDSILPQTFATPMMVLLMENAALNAIRPYLEAGESAVGSAIDVEHIAATPVGFTVTAEAEVTKVDGRRIEFNVSARDGKEQIGRGTHRRMAIDLGRFNERLALKAKA